MPVVKVKSMYDAPSEHDGVRLTVCGWVRTIRDMKTFGFMELNDGSCFKGVQIVFEEGRLANFKDITKQNVGAAVTVTGTFKLTEGAKQPFEISAEEISVVGESAPEYPLQKKRHSVEFLRTIAHLRPRTNLFSAVFLKSSTGFSGWTISSSSASGLSVPGTGLLSGSVW